jgi:hypothetical protein
VEVLDDLERRLLGLGISAGSFHLGGPRDECYCMEPVGGARWAVFYYERGERVSRSEFATVTDAAAELERRLLSDPTARR